MLEISVSEIRVEGILQQSRVQGGVSVTVTWKHFVPKGIF